MESVRSIVDACDGLAHMPKNPHVYIKPNIVFWTRAVQFPKWGVITTSRTIEDMICILKDHGVNKITIGEGTVVANPKDKETPQHAFQSLGYDTLKKRYGVDYINVFDRPFESVDLGDDFSLNFNKDILESDFVVDIPVLKSHNQTVVSLGIKNLKGCIDIISRRRCHNKDPYKNLNAWVSRLADKMPPIFTLLDGIFTNERGPGIDGRMRRSNILAGSPDILSADFVGAKLLGHEPSNVPHLVYAAKNRNRPLDLSDIQVVGDSIESLASFHDFDFKYHEDENCCLPLPLAKQGIKGIFYRKYDMSMCTYCSGINGVILSAIRYAWKGEPWDKIEVLTGKYMTPAPGMKKTILLGKCMYKANKDNPNINEMIAIKGCPPNPDDVVKALHQAGIDADPALFQNLDQMPAFFMGKYADKPEFDPKFFTVE
ncbi:MAG: hypothetical protein OMM_08496 [Candidatus Magnetoglobus multicellularis str. Araruama]|uniref:DUF362 domain-containing protein n=1 Tax=Candidatus Magnetoglobus multicellularis str. Araruama TaxID=890399 RepID=A0A1V1P7K6_9BACT|nr:MAG: hypothetical protein OMM_08496 [Candidatus Magnetoglobus multicellularis str. Araruama]